MQEVEYMRNVTTGILEIWRNGKYEGSVILMGNQQYGIISFMPSLCDDSRAVVIGKSDS